MAEFQLAPMSPRVKRLLDAVHTANHSRVYIDSERTRIFTEFYKTHEAMPDNLKRAHCLYEWAANKTIRVEDDDILVGNMGMRYRALNPYIEWDNEWVYNATHMEDEAFKARYQSPGCFAYIADEDLPIFREAAEYWRDRGLVARCEAILPPEFLERIGDGCQDVYARGSKLGTRSQGHFVANFSKVINKGFAAIKQEAQAHLDEMKGKLFGDAPTRQQYYMCTILVCDAGITLAKRYAAACAEKAASTEDAQRKAELLQMSDSLNHIMEYPCRTAWEAMQATLLYHMLLMAEGDQHGLTLGRVDQYAGWFAKDELEKGTLTLQRLQDIADAFYIKLNDHIVICDVGAKDATAQMYNKHNTGEEKHNFGTNGQHLTVGGQRPDGSDATNPMTIAILMASARMRFTDPSLSCRIHDGTPDNVWQTAVEASKINGGVPTLENDNVLIPVMMDRGISLEDARDYCIVGCVEPTIGGKEYAACGFTGGKESFFNMLGCIVGAIHNGCNPATGYTAGPKTGYLYDYKTFEDFKAAYAENLRYYLGYMISFENIYEYVYGRYFPPVACSATVDGCMESGKDVMEGGALYNSAGLTGCGIGNVADCLAAIKKLCFDDKTVTLHEMYDALCANWEGYEELRQTIINECPHYGNNIDYVDELAVWAMNQFCDIAHSMNNGRAHFAPSTFTMTLHLDMGINTAATPDGRKHGEPLCDAISSRQGLDKNGPTAYLLSAAKLPHRKISNGDQLNIRFSPTAVRGEAGYMKLRQMIQTYFDLGGMQVQFNVVSTDQLHDAQEHPEDYANMVVRIAGFSAYFVEMPKHMQDDFISRTEQTM